MDKALIYKGFCLFEINNFPSLSFLRKVIESDKLAVEGVHNLLKILDIF